MKHEVSLNRDSNKLMAFPHVQMLGHRLIRKIDAGTLPRHVNPGIEICYIHKGRFNWSVEENPVCALPGTTTLTLPWQQHGGTREVMDIGELSWIILRPDRFDRSGKLRLGTWSSLPSAEQHYVARQILEAPSPIVIPKYASVCIFFKEILAEVETQRHGRIWRVNRLIDELLLSLARALERSTLGTQREAFNPSSPVGRVLKL
ncbi:MAG: AraC family ligand binding domain-containing protein [bacterium]